MGAAPALYNQVFLGGPQLSSGGILKGIDVDLEPQVTDMLTHLKSGSLDGLKTRGRYPGIILGSGLARNTGMMLDRIVSVISFRGDLTPVGLLPNTRSFRVVGIFESGFFQYDEAWAYTSLQAAQQLLSLPDVVNEIELKLDNPDLAPQITKQVQEMIGTGLVATNWMLQNRPLLNAFEMEKKVTFVTIGLILLIAALNILISLVMMVMEKYRDIAVLMSMGARRSQIRKIFMLQGVLIGV